MRPQMIWASRQNHRFRTVLTILVAVGLLFVPMVGAMAMPCHDHNVPIPMAATTHGSLVGAPMGDAEFPLTNHPNDHKACYSGIRSLCVAMVEAANTIFLNPPTVDQHYPLATVAIRGLALTLFSPGGISCLVRTG